MRIGTRAAGDVHPSPGTILDDNRLSPALLQLVGERADEHVTVGGDDPHRLARIGLGGRRRCVENRRRHRDEQEYWRFHHALARAARLHLSLRRRVIG